MKKFGDPIFWSEVWSRYLETYLNAPPRCGFWISSFFSKRYSILEIAAGSCRDSIYLSSIGYNVVALDFDSKTLNYLAKRFTNLPLLFVVGDAFALPFENKSFDISFSNGFWICFDDNHSLHLLIREQARVTKKYLITFVHNMDNEFLMKLFREKSLHDPLYNIRFFTRNELVKIVKESGVSFRSISFYKFGGPADLLYSLKSLRFIARLFVPKIYKLQPWRVTERIACVVELE